MASLKFRHYATESALKGNGTVQNALNAFDVGTIVFIDDTQKQYIITSKSNNVVTYKIYYGKAAVVGVSGTDAARILTFSDGSEIKVTINNVEHATSSDTANTAKSVAWNNVTGKPTNFVTTDGTQTITGAKIFTNNVSLQGSTSADSITTEDLIVNGAARFVSGLTGDLKGDVVGNVTGNVTGNVSGSSGSCTGNALTATTLQTARSINGTSFNGSQAITTAKWGTARNITIADNTNEHTQVNNSIDGSADFTLKLPATIKADIIGNASTANSAKSVAWANVTNKPNLVTTDTEQTITGAKIFNNNTAFKNETDVESLTADSLLVTGSARFTNIINGNLKGNVEGNLTGNASTATTATTCTGNAGTATTLQNTRKINGTDFNGSADITTSKWGTARNITISDGTNSGTATSVDGSGAIILNLPGTIKANLSGNAATATKATNADRATGDSDGNTINTTYLKRSGGIMTGTINIGKTTNQDTDVMLRLTEYTNGNYLGGFINYDGANNILNIGVHEASDSNKSNDTNVISITRTSANIGIGKTNPGSKLDVNGTVTATGFVGPLTGNVTGNASSATNATNDGAGNTITSTYATKTERSNNDITAASLTASKLTLTRTAGNITANIPTWNQDTTGTAAKATADAKGNNIINTYATKAEVAALPKSMVIKGTLDSSHSLPTSGMTEGDTYIVGASGTYNKIACKVGDFFVRTSNSWLRIPAGDEWEYNENTIKGIKVDNAGHADTAGAATAAGSATSDGNGNNIVNTYARIDKVYDDSSTYRQFLGKDGSSSDWVRTTTSGILPYTSGDSSNGHSSLGTSSWYFSKAYIQNIYGYLNGNISGSSTSCSGNSATATTATNVNGGYGNLTSLITNNIVMYPLGGYCENSTSANQYFRIKLGTTFDNSAMIVFDVVFRHYGQIVKYSIESYLYGNTNKWYMPCVTALTNISSTLNEKVLFAYDSENHPIVYIKRTGGAYDQCWVENIRVGLAGTITNFNNVSISNVDGIIEGDTKQVEKTPITWASNAISADIATSAISANTATKAGYLDTGTMTLYAHNSNEINFGGTSTSSEIYVGYRATENRPIPTKFIFGGSGTATLTAGGFKKSDSSSSYVLTGDGGHAAISELSVKYATTSGACTGNAATATKLQTPRTIWGQSFDGSGNVSGKISNVGDILPATTHVSNLGSSSLVWERLYGRYIDTDGGYYLRLCAGGTEVVTITDPSVGSNVGIGITSPTSKLHVAGTGYFASDVSSAANIIAGGYIKGETVKISSGCTLQYDSTQKCIRFVFS